ncbi:MAG: hypothetical protein KF906_03180 [Actinobacteria bacterium]|nr:hypothetical protein [Actinomycetota bacterium]
MTELRTHRSPAQAALAEWDAYPNAGAHVVRVTFEDEDHAIVVVDTVPSHPMWNYCERTPRGWVYTHDHDGPAIE